MNKKLMSIKDLSKKEILEIIEKTNSYKTNFEKDLSLLKGKRMLLLFEKTSTRTRISFEAGFSLLGGYSIYVDSKTTNIGLSDLKDEIRYISSNVDIIVARMLKNEDLETIMKYSSVPVINGCCNMYHPCQILADLFTIYEEFNDIENVTLSFIGNLNNVSRDLIFASYKLGFKLIFVTPNCQEVEKFLKKEELPIDLLITQDMEFAVRNSDVVYTDTWVDMEFFENWVNGDTKPLLNSMLPYQVNDKVFSFNPKVKIMHDMPMHINYEITRNVIENNNSIIFKQAENRMWVQNIIVKSLLEVDKK